MQEQVILAFGFIFPFPILQNNPFTHLLFSWTFCIGDHLVKKFVKVIDACLLQILTDFIGNIWVDGDIVNFIFVTAQFLGSFLFQVVKVFCYIQGSITGPYRSSTLLKAIKTFVFMSFFRCLYISFCSTFNLSYTNDKTNLSGKNIFIHKHKDGWEK